MLELTQRYNLNTNMINLPINEYCERAGSTAFLAEPINAFSNLAFLVAGFLAYRFLKKKKIKDKSLLVLPWILSAICIGSFVFHTARSSFTVIFDLLFIYIFLVCSLVIVLKNLLNSKLKIIAILIVYASLQILLTIYLPKEFLNGSFRHVVTISLLFVLGGFIHRKYGNKIMKPLLAVFGFYILAILLRSIDMSICPIFPIGTHFLWHILNALAGYYAILLLTKIKTSTNTSS